MKFTTQHDLCKSKAFVQCTSLPIVFEIQFFSYKIGGVRQGEDTGFNHAFCARREAEERSNDTVLIHATLSRSKVNPC